MSPAPFGRTVFRENFPVPGLTEVGMSQSKTDPSSSTSPQCTEEEEEYEDIDEHPSLPSTSWSPIQQRNLFREADRLKTFDNWPVTFLSPRTMTAAGFYYLKREDVVRCAFCGIEIGRWVPGDDPKVDHARWSPGCGFIKYQHVGNIPLLEDGETSTDNVNNYDTCGTTTMNGINGINGINGVSEIKGVAHERNPDVLEKHYGYQKTREPSFPQYSSYNSRLTSYETWPISLKLKPDVLSDAGFFYTGKSDQTVCFHCGGGLKDWEENDEPWVEHARWFSKCPFVMLVKGKEFIDEVSGSKASLEIKTSNGAVGLSSSTGDLEKQSTSKQADLLNAEVNMQGESSGCGKKSNLTNGETNDGRLCKICYMEEMGVVFLPCGHIVACVKCALSLRTCAVCRKAVTATFRAFLS